MLVLTRKLGEEIVIGGNVVIALLEIRPGQVKLGIAAPQDVSVHRREVQTRVERDNAARG